MTNLRERRALLRRFLPTARKVQITRSVSNLDLSHARSVLIIGAGDDPYRQCFPNAQRYVRLDLEYVDGTIDLMADAVALPFPENCFDCVMATEVLEYVFQPPKFAAEVHRVLCRNGMAVITVPFIFNFHKDYWRPTILALQELFRSYASVTVQAQGTRLLTIWDLITTSFWPHPILMPLRIFSNLLYLVPRKIMCADSKSSAPTGYLVLARK